MLALIIFAGAILAGYSSFAMLLFEHWRLCAIERRVGLIMPRERKSEASVPKGSGHFAALMPLRKVFTFRMRRSWGVSASPAYLTAIGSVAAVIMWFAARAALTYRGDVAGLAAAVGFFLGPRLLLAAEQRRAERAFSEQLPDAIDMVVRIVRAGLPVAVAIRTAARETDPPLSTVFAKIADQTEIGMPLNEALDKLSVGLGNPDFRFFAMAVSLQHATGGNLATTLDTLSDIIRKRRAIRMKARATSAEVKISGLVLGAIPFVVVGALLMVAPAYLEPLLADKRGNMILGIAAVSLLSAAIVMRAIIRNSMRV